MTKNNKFFTFWCFGFAIKLIRFIVIHVKKIKKRNNAFSQKRASVNKTSKFYLNLPSLRHMRHVIPFVGFIVITLALLASVTLIGSESFSTQASNDTDSVRVITNFYYDQHKSTEFEAVKIK